jgi:hypothetical protein
LAVAAAGFGLLAAACGLHPTALSQNAAGLDAKAQGRAILAHLSSVIQFYQSVNQPIQDAGEPNDVVYRDQADAEATQIADLAFDSAKAEARLNTSSSPVETTGEDKLQTAESNAEKRITDLESQDAILDKQLSTASPAAAERIESQKRQVRAALGLAYAMKDALGKILSMSTASTSTGLAADVDRLRRSLPELDSANKTSVPQIITVQSALSQGVVTQARALLDLLEARHTLSMLIEDDDRLNQAATGLRAPLSSNIQSLLQQGEQLSEQPAIGQAPPQGSTNSSPGLPPTQTLEAITAKFKTLATAAIPLSQEVIVLGQARANLSAWKASVSDEYGLVVHALLLRILVMAIALGIIIGGGELWTRGTNKYIHDLRRRRQLLIVRRVVVGFLSVIVILFGFITQFNSLATFAGFITAGIAVGLQTILLSVAAYFFIIGRYGIKVGDRITISSVTGEVIDVGLVRFHLMELAGAGPGLNPTGRVAVFSNAVLFQAGTPLYKQVPGTGYSWHELTMKLADAADYGMVSTTVMKTVHAIYDEYRDNIELQHEGMRNWLQAAVESPKIESRLQLSNGVFQLWVRFGDRREDHARAAGADRVGPGDQGGRGRDTLDSAVGTGVRNLGCVRSHSFAEQFDESRRAKSPQGLKALLILWPFGATEVAP